MQQLILVAALALGACAGAQTTQSSAPAPAPRPYSQMKDSEIDALIQATYGSTPKALDRLVKYSEGFVGVPYVLFPLGIAPKGGVENPPIRFDAADCTTMVETLMAMSRARDLKEATANMALVRYKGGVVSQADKNDVPETDWIPNNIAAGFLVDITTAVAGKGTRINTKVVRVKAYTPQEIDEITQLAQDDPAKAIEAMRNMNAIGGHFNSVKASLPYVPLALLKSVGSAIPSGAIFSVVREARPDKEVMVTHQGLIIQKADGPWVRHLAFQDKGVDVPLLDYFGKPSASWKILGINLTLLREP